MQYSLPWLTHFSVAKMSKPRNGARIETWIQSWRFLFHMADDLFFTMRICTSHRNSIHIDFVGWFFHVLQMLANHWLPDYHINMLSSNILSLGSFFFQHRPLDTFCGRLHYIISIALKS